MKKKMNEQLKAHKKHIETKNIHFQESIEKSFNAKIEFLESNNKNRFSLLAFNLYSELLLESSVGTFPFIKNLLNCIYWGENSDIASDKNLLNALRSELLKIIGNKDILYQLSDDKRNALLKIIDLSPNSFGFSEFKAVLSNKQEANNNLKSKIKQRQKNNQN